MSGSVFTGQHHSRPDIYAGSRRRFTGLGTVAAGFVALVLVLGALLTSELGRYSEPEAPPLDAQATGPVLPPAAPPGAPPSAAAGGTPAPSASPTPTTPGTPSGSPDAPVGDDTNRTVLATVNRALTELGCPKVALSPTLIEAARAHLDTMVRTGYLALSMPDGTDPADRARAAGYRGDVVEAIVLGAETPNQATAIGLPPAAGADDTLPGTVRVVSRSTLKCGYTAVGAGYGRDSRNVPIAVLVLGA